MTRFGVVLCAVAVAVSASAQEVSDKPAPTAGVLEFKNARLRRPPPATSVTAGFVDIINHGGEDVLLSLSADFAESAEIHDVIVVNNVMKMRPLPAGLPIVGNGERVRLRSGGLHLMFFGVRPLKESGEMVTLYFSQQGAIPVHFSLDDMSSGNSGHAH